MLCLLCPANQHSRIISLFIIQFLIIKGGLNPTRYTANPDYDITRLIWSIFLTYKWEDRHTHTHWREQTSLKNPFWKQSSETNMFLCFTVSRKNKCVIRSEVWTVRCEGTVTQSGRKSSVQMESNQIILLLQISTSEVPCPCIWFCGSLETIKIKASYRRKLQGVFKTKYLVTVKLRPDSAKANHSDCTPLLASLPFFQPVSDVEGLNWCRNI